MTDKIIGYTAAAFAFCVGFILNGFRLRINEKASSESCLLKHLFLAEQYIEIKDILKAHSEKLDKILQNGDKK